MNQLFLAKFTTFVIASHIVIVILANIFVNGQDDQIESHCETFNSENVTTSGFCINVKTNLKFCPSHYSLLKNKNWDLLKKHVCSSDYKRVCCPVADYDESSVDEAAEKEDYTQHPNFKILPTLRACGVSFHSSGDRILGGNASIPGEFPWIARIGMQRTDNLALHYPCGGSIISKRYILTAAHCFKHPNLKLVNIRIGQSNELLGEECIELDSRRRFGRRTTRQVDKIIVECAKPRDIAVEELIVHEGYTKEVGSPHDIALIRLAEDIDLSASFFTKPICLPFLNEYHVKTPLDESKLLKSEHTIVAGFGKVNNDEQVGSSTLQFARSPIQQNIMCRIAYPYFNISHTQICSGGITGVGSCQGDSGGPLLFPATPEKISRNLRHFQLGVVSYGKSKCAQQNEPVVYTKVRSYLNWILDKIRE